jgi:predicted methyltransferase
MTTHQPESPKIELVETVDGEVTLLIDGGQAMQGWERDLMNDSADMLCAYGSEFLEVGLGLGLSALRIATHPNTVQHVVVEKYQQVIDLFLERHPNLPPTLKIVHADFFDYIHQVQPDSIDGIFFDPYLPPDVSADEALWNEVVPKIFRAIRPGGAFVPFATTKPVLRWQFAPFFDRIIVEPRRFAAYPTTEYMSTLRGTAYIQCYLRL